jgi:hypothetical protein
MQRLGVPGGGRFVGKGVSYYATRNFEKFAGKAETNAVANFKRELQMSCISMRPVTVTEAKPGLRERAEGLTAQPIYRISWEGRPIRLLRWFPLASTSAQGARFLKVSPRRVRMPGECGECYALAQNSRQTEEVAFFWTRVSLVRGSAQRSPFALQIGGLSCADGIRLGLGLAFPGWTLAVKRRQNP